MRNAPPHSRPTTPRKTSAPPRICPLRIVYRKPLPPPPPPPPPRTPPPDPRNPPPLKPRLPLPTNEPPPDADGGGMFSAREVVLSIVTSPSLNDCKPPANPWPTLE